jgi:hypothetical protein
VMDGGLLLPARLTGVAVLAKQRRQAPEPCHSRILNSSVGGFVTPCGFCSLAIPRSLARRHPSMGASCGVSTSPFSWAPRSIAELFRALSIWSGLSVEYLARKQYGAFAVPAIGNRYAPIRPVRCFGSRQGAARRRRPSRYLVKKSASWTTVRTGRSIHPYHGVLSPPFHTRFRDFGELRPHTSPSTFAIFASRNPQSTPSIAGERWPAPGTFPAVSCIVAGHRSQPGHTICRRSRSRRSLRQDQTLVHDR